MSRILPVYHHPDGRRVVGWPGTWQDVRTNGRRITEGGVSPVAVAAIPIRKQL